MKAYRRYNFIPTYPETGMDTPVATPNRHGADGASARGRSVGLRGRRRTRYSRSKLSGSPDESTVTASETADDGLTSLENASYDCVVSEYRLPDRDGIELLRAVRDQSFDLPFLLFTDDGDESVASDASQPASRTTYEDTLENRRCLRLRQRITAAGYTRVTFLL